MAKILCFVALLLMSCRTSPPESKTNYSFSAINAGEYSTIIGRLELIKMGKLKRENLSICIKGQLPQSLNSEDLLLQTKLSFALWLFHSGRDSQAEWARLKFQPALCDDPSKQNQVDLIIKSVSNQQGLTSRKITFEKNQGGIQHSYNTTLKGAVTAAFDDKINSSDTPTLDPILLELNNNIDWIGFLEQVDMANYSNDIKSQLKKCYEKIRQDHGSSISDLVIFGEMLRNHKVEKVDLRYVEKYQQLFEQSGESSKTFDMKPFHFSLLYIMLHEVGHAFGMMHADTPQSGEVNGQAWHNYDDVLEDGDTPYTTKEAVMAYGQSSYLTEDDIAGIRSLNKRTVEFLSQFK